MKDRIKRLVSVLLCTVMLTALASCNAEENGEDEPVFEPVRIPTWFFDKDKEKETEKPIFSKASEVSVMIDAGHGFDDPGLTSPLTDATEAQITSKVADLVTADLAGRGYNVLVTHDGKTFPTTRHSNGDRVYDDGERIDFANSLSADIMLSLHCGIAYGDGAESVRGVRLSYCDDPEEKHDEPADLCESLRDALHKKYPDYKTPVINADPPEEAYHITRYSDKCTVLCIMGCLSNKDDAQNLTDPEWQKDFAEALCDGIDAYFIDKYE